MPKRKKFLLFAFKFLVSFSLVVYILIKIAPIKDIANVLKEASLLWILLSFSLHSLGLLISAYRWQILIRAHGDSAPLGFLAKSYLVGNFFNLFLPTRFGGDLVRIWDGSRYSRSLIKSSAIVLVERLSGIIVLLLFAFAVSLFRLDMAQKVPIIWVSLLGGFIGLLFLIIFTIIFILPISEGFLHRIPDRGILRKLKEKIFIFRKAVLVYKEKKRPFFQALFWAFWLQINVILHYFLVGKALHLPISFLDYFVFIPIILIVLAVPVTISGLGLREALCIEIFKFYGISSAAAFSFPLVADITFGLIIGIIGGIIYMIRK